MSDKYLKAALQKIDANPLTKKSAQRVLALLNRWRKTPLTLNGE